MSNYHLSTSTWWPLHSIHAILELILKPSTKPHLCEFQLHFCLFPHSYPQLHSTSNSLTAKACLLWEYQLPGCQQPLMSVSSTTELAHELQKIFFHSTNFLFRLFVSFSFCNSVVCVVCCVSMCVIGYVPTWLGVLVCVFSLCWAHGRRPNVLLCKLSAWGRELWTACS